VHGRLINSHHHRYEVVDPQNSNLPSLFLLASAISAQPEMDLLAPSDTLAATTSFGQISLVSISGLIGRNHLVGFIGLDVVSLICFISLNGHIGLVGRISHNGLIDVIGLSLIKLSVLSNHWLISLIGVIGLGVIASSALTASLACRLISFVSLVGSLTHRLFCEQCLAAAVFEATQISWQLKQAAALRVATLQSSTTETAASTYYFTASLLHMHSLVREKMLWWLTLARKKMSR
jgi:hypothetical protein